MKYLLILLLPYICCHLVPTPILETHNVTPKAERVFIPLALNESLGHNVTKEFWDRYRQTSLIMMQVLSFHQIFYSSEVTLTMAAATVLLENIRSKGYRYANYTSRDMRDCIFESFNLLPPSFQKKFVKFLKSVKEKYLNDVKEPRIAKKAKELVQAFKNGKLFTYKEGMITLSVNNMTANERWEASVYDPERLLYIEYPSFAEINAKIVVDPLPYLKRFETYSRTLAPNTRDQVEEGSGDDIDNSESSTSDLWDEDDVITKTSIPYSSRFYTATLSPIYPVSQQTQQSQRTSQTDQTAQTQQFTQRSQQTDQTQPSLQTQQTDQTQPSLQTQQTDQTQPSLQTQSPTQQPSQPPSISATLPNLSDFIDSEKKATATEQTTARGVANMPRDIFSFSFLHHQSETNMVPYDIISNPSTPPSTINSTQSIVELQSTVITVNSTNSQLPDLLSSTVVATTRLVPTTKFKEFEILP